MTDHDRKDREEDEEFVAAPSSPTPETASHSPATPSHDRKSQKLFIDILRAIENFHSALTDYYARHKAMAEQPRAQLLLAYMAEHEKHVAECIKAYEEQADDVVLRSWFKYTPSIDPEAWLQEIEWRADMTEDEVLGIVVRLDEMMQQVYRELANQAVPDQLQEAVQNLLELEKREEIRAEVSVELDG